MPSLERKRLWIALGVVLVAGFLVYARTFQVPWYLDDVRQIVENQEIRDLGRAAGRILEPRGLGDFTFAADFARSGYSLAAFHATNLFIHLLAGTVCLLVLRQTMPGPIEWPLLGALIFTVHPLQTQAVTYVVQRYASLTALLCLSSLLFFLEARKALETPEKGWKQAGFLLPYLSSVLLGAAACFVKQNAVVLPCLLALWVWLVPEARDPRSSWFRKVVLVAPFVVVPVIVAWPAVRVLLVGSVTTAGAATPVYESDVVGEQATPVYESDVVGEQATPLAYAATELEVLWRYLRLVVWPVGQVFDLGLGVDPEPIRPGTILAGLGLLAMVVAVIVLRRRMPVVSLGILWFLVAISVESSIVVLDPYVEHRMYLPMFGIAMAIAAGLSRVDVIRAGWRTALIVLLIVPLGLIAFRRNEQWREPAKLWQADLDAGSESYRSVVGLADALHRRGDLERANDVYRDFVRLAVLRCESSGCGTKYLMNAGVAAGRVGDKEQALALLRKAAESSPDYATAHYNLGVLLHETGRKREALDAFDRARKLSPGDSDALFNWAMVALDLGDPAPAIETVPRLSDLNPSLGAELSAALEERSSGRPGGAPETRQSTILPVDP